MGIRGFRQTGIISFSHSGDFSKTEEFLKKASTANSKLMSLLNAYGKKGVDALSDATPKKTGKTANSWSYEVKASNKQCSITWSNSNVNKGVNIAVILNYGHGTKTGGYVKGYYYIEPAIRPIFDEMVEKLWKEVT